LKILLFIFLFAAMTLVLTTFVVQNYDESAASFCGYGAAWFPDMLCNISSEKSQNFL
jgi:hypothetical protein